MSQVRDHRRPAPNTRGGAFVHDPKMANEKEVKAQCDAKKAGGLTMKTLESILSVDDGSEKNGKRGTISTKCAEMDTEIPALLGVSKAVLENVIFCHQEDSYWPLAEPSALKKKYTKALDNIKTLRKERIADLKAEKERLQSLQTEKAHADKLRARITELKSTIHAKEIQYEETKNQYEEQVTSNNKYYEYASRFREIYVKIETLQEKQKNLKDDLEESRVSVPEIGLFSGTDEELQQRLERFDENISKQRNTLKDAKRKKEDIEDGLKSSRIENQSILQESARFQSESKQQQQRLQEREQLIREIGDKFGIGGFGQEPLDGPKAEIKSHQEEYNAKSRQLTAASEKHKADRSSLRQQITERNSAITKGERELEISQELPGQLKIITGNVEEKTRRLEKLKADFKTASYDQKISQNTEKKTIAESKREKLNQEFIMLNREAESRANLNLKRKEVVAKKNEIESTVDNANTRFGKLVGKAASADTIENAIEEVAKQKNHELELAETDARIASGNQQGAEAALSEKKRLLREKQKDLKDAKRRMNGAYEHNTLEEAIKDAMDQLQYARDERTTGAEAGKVYERLLMTGKQKKKCTACDRHMNDDEIRVFEKYLKGEINRAAQGQGKHKIEEDISQWTIELERLQGLRPTLVLLNTLELKEIPDVENDIKKAVDTIESTKEKAERTSEQVSKLKEELKDVQTVRDYGKTIARLQKEVERLNREVESLENELAASGSTKSTEDVQAEIEDLANEMWVYFALGGAFNLIIVPLSRLIDKENNSLMRERDRQNGAQRSIEGELHHLEVESTKIMGQIKEKETLEKQVRQWKQEIVDMSERIKVAEQCMADAQGPIDALDIEYKTSQRQFDGKMARVSVLVQQLNRKADNLGEVQKHVERYVQQRREQRQRECETRLEESNEEIKKYEKQVEDARDAMSKVERDISESGSNLTNLRENFRLRKIVKQIKETQAEIDSYDMEEAARSKRTFHEKWTVVKEKEEKLQQKFSHIAGEISSHKSQLKTWETDAKDYADANKNFTDQLIKVKMSDMANNDLEKYGKALENAIMKYHTLKMEEVNDTMRHLWNKTYQGSDIDGIKIRSDVEGGASKRSYNYRVVMTKDQVEMDMRGRCSAGQKMLASIIIRLALSDSFGQNCGILALDEPTNALDTENIEALASSLVDIINERKNHANFQLIIITHDENFLRKLGQSDVMEYYWQVMRISLRDVI
ncbi:hypothetical protein BDP27DRAFT_1413505 [Rhodocollybia butyracea]|uniref:DNA repair protein RAD50 n=1 Tax=Rhodocollybia butyracea TaxID=206335 RepID=A0A9P5UG09_9AGAR|nr:hypothetical protein BDP27DRAFT_1413505 [Rhodocollybia butyracea]